MHILMIFLDGIGLGEVDPSTNPFSAANLPTLHSLSNGQPWLRTASKQETGRALFIPTDPRMGVPGRPQSGSNQATIVTGLNVPQLIGEHYGPKPNEAIREILDRDNLFMRVVNAGQSAAILEAYPPPWHRGINSGKRLPSSYQYAARAAGLSFFGADDLRAGDALSGDWTGEGWQTQLKFTDTPVYSGYEAGVKIVELSRRYDFAFFPHWITDTVGHRGTIEDGVELLETFDEVMRGVLDTWQDDEGIVIITSDHGNMEAMQHGKHTENNVPTVIIGQQRHVFDDLVDLSGIASRIEQLLKIQPNGTTQHEA